MLKNAITTDFFVQAEDDLARLADEWRALQSQGRTTVFDTYEWCEAWYNTAGKTAGTTLCIVTGRDRDGFLKFLLPLGVTCRSGARVVHWLSDTVATYGLGVYDANWLKEAGDKFHTYWPAICAALPPADVIWLTNLPETWHAKPHPLRQKFTRTNANCSFYLKINADFETLYAAKRNTKSRARARKKVKLLQEVGNLKFGLPQPGEEMHRVLDDMFRHQTERLARIGVYNVFDEPSKAFVHRLADLPVEKSAPVLRPYVLSIDGQTIAVKLGMEFGDTFWAMVSSLRADGLERMSPGDIALRQTIQACCNAGLTSIDLAQGESDYKTQWADGAIQLHTIMAPLNIRGTLWAQAMSLSLTCKRTIKTSDTLWPLAQRLRAQLLGRKLA